MTGSLTAYQKQKTMTGVRSILVALMAIALGQGAAQAQQPKTADRMPPSMVLRSRQRFWEGASRPDQAPQVLSSVPTWSPLFPTPNDPDLVQFRAVHSAVYDPGSNTMIVFGGFDATFTPQSNVLLETNANGSGGAFGGTWSELNLSFVPPARTSHSAVYDQTNNRMIVFGGRADSECLIPLNDTWVLTNANGLGGAPSWTQLTPTGGPPDAIDGSTAVYDPVSNVMTVFAGGNFLNSVWTLSNANGVGGTPAWTNLIANGVSGSPPGRIDGAAIYDPTSNRMTIYGGNSGGGINNPDFDFAPLGDVWVLANANGSGGSPAWTQLHPKVAGDRNVPPVGRIFFTAVRDTGTNSMIIFGGETIEGMYFSTWVLSHANGL